MTIPGFTAEASVYLTGTFYRMSRGAKDPMSVGGVFPALLPDVIRCKCTPTVCVCCWFEGHRIVCVVDE